MTNKLSPREKEIAQKERMQWRRAIYACDLPIEATMKLDTLIDYLYEETDFFYAPASTKYHSAYPGGLSEHSRLLTGVLLQLTNQKRFCYDWQRAESPIIIGLLHDLTKVGCYLKAEDYSDQTPKYKYNEDKLELSKIHGEDSLLKAQQLNELTELTEEESACIRWHMGAYEIDAWDDFDQAIHQFPNVLWTHTADMMASKVLEKTDAE